MPLAWRHGEWRREQRPRRAEYANDVRAMVGRRGAGAGAVRRREQALRRYRRGRAACRSIFSRASSSPCSARPAAARPRCCACWPASRRRTRDASCSTARISPACRRYRRPVNMMFQSYALFPHLTVEGNVAFGLKQERLAASRDRGARRGDAGAGAARRLRQTQAAPALRRTAPARRARALAGEATRASCCSTSRSRRSTRSCAAKRSSS